MAGLSRPATGPVRLGQGNAPAVQARDLALLPSRINYRRKALLPAHASSEVAPTRRIDALEVASGTLDPSSTSATGAAVRTLELHYDTPTELDFPVHSEPASGPPAERHSASNAVPSSALPTTAAVAAESSSSSSVPDDLEQPPESGVLPQAAESLESTSSMGDGGGGSGAMAKAALSKKERSKRAKRAAAARANAMAATADASMAGGSLVYPPEERLRIRNSWTRLMRWSRSLRQREAAKANERRLEKVVVFGGGSFGTAMGVSLARQHPGLHVTLLLRDAYLCRDINELHCNTRYLPKWQLPDTVTATTSAAEAIAGAQYAIHAVPVQHTRAFLEGIKVRGGSGLSPCNISLPTSWYQDLTSCGSAALPSFAGSHPAHDAHHFCEQGRGSVHQPGHVGPHPLSPGSKTASSVPFRALIRPRGDGAAPHWHCCSLKG